MVSIRPGTVEDLMYMQHCNLHNLPENYKLKYFLYHGLSWPHLLYVAESSMGKIVGYVLAKLGDDDEEDGAITGNITSLSVFGTYRKLGIATKLMRATEYAMQSIYGCYCCRLQVRVMNKAAISLYTEVLGFEIVKRENNYYADGEDAFGMKLDFGTLRMNKCDHDHEGECGHSHSHGGEKKDIFDVEPEEPRQ